MADTGRVNESTKHRKKLTGLALIPLLHVFSLITSSICLHTECFLFNLSYTGLISSNPIGKRYNPIASPLMQYFQIQSENKPPNFYFVPGSYGNIAEVFQIIRLKDCPYPQFFKQ